jgi:hypothetical protein
MMNPEEIVIAAASLVLEELTLDELAAMNSAAQLGTDPRGCNGWDKASSLFTIIAADGTPQAHQLVKDAFAATVNARLERDKHHG